MKKFFIGQIVQSNDKAKLRNNFGKKHLKHLLLNKGVIENIQGNTATVRDENGQIRCISLVWLEEYKAA